MRACFNAIMFSNYAFDAIMFLAIMAFNHGFYHDRELDNGQQEA